ncbi:PP2C family protein-serine/threonine phosphatase [Kineococcus rubinsiae]|uniref:PP2C family protein-serine/threonine phosphatase n=1 Tax=Kineococcus rubinsiae TaxID=2609562 RepID=UPI001AD8EB5C|nr:PP2C family protein-serine/threonine phosphatase [Kineococcus rubinsiae]
MLRTTLQRRVSAIAVGFLLVVLVLVGILVSVQSGRDTSAGTQGWNPVITANNQFRSSLVGVNLRQQLYLRDARPADLRQLQVELSQLQRDRAALDDAADAAGAPDVRRRVDGIFASVDRWLAVSDEFVEARQQPDQTRYDELRQGPATGLAFIPAYAADNDLTGFLETGREAALVAAQENSDRLLLAQALVAGTALLLVPTILFLVRRWVLRPLDELSDQLLRVGGGDLQTPVGLAGPPELAAVAAAAETMRRRILDELADAVSAREALQQGQPLVAEVRDQLAAHDLPIVPGWSAAAALRPAEGLLAGDWYDVLPLRDGRFAVVVADVSGHGARAGIVAIQLKRLLEAALHLAPEPDLAMALAARVFADEAERFASCVVVVVDPDSGSVTYANAGHPAPLVLRSDGGVVRVVGELEATGPLLSWLHLDTPGAWTTRTTSLAPGSLLVVYTDGLVEARPTGTTDELGVEGVLAALQELEDLTPQTLVDEALDVARRWSGGRARDDVTLVAFERGGGLTGAVPAARAAGEGSAPE